MLTKLSNAWTAIKTWFQHSEVIFMAQLEAFIGLITAAAAQVDFTNLTIDLKDIKTTAVAGLGMFIHGILLVLARRRNDPYLGQ